ncbi:ribosomal protein L17 [Viridothelium virens]|uniref:Large ribosomal subunit protein bL17m n=1 Tax=Viridothelium virens TaxID=1048519 RepID=A0A6A6H054_VIRVR|nr:ribosomal protein L17 [Viridothelium virens]
MAGGHMKYRTLSRKSSHRQALLKNLVTSLFEHESICTTWHKAKEAQRLAEKLITLGKRNTEASKRSAHSKVFRPLQTVPRLFGPLRERYADRAGGYTRVSLLEPVKEDQARSALLELVDGPRDMRFAMTARTLARLREKGQEINDITANNIRKVTRFREDGENALEEMVQKFEKLAAEGDKGATKVEQKKVYPESTLGR